MKRLWKALRERAASLTQPDTHMTDHTPARLRSSSASASNIEYAAGMAYEVDFIDISQHVLSEDGIDAFMNTIKASPALSHITCKPENRRVAELLSRQLTDYLATNRIITDIQLAGFPILEIELQGHLARNQFLEALSEDPNAAHLTFLDPEAENFYVHSHVTYLVNTAKSQSSHRRIIFDRASEGDAISKRIIDGVLDTKRQSEAAASTHSSRLAEERAWHQQPGHGR